MIRRILITGVPGMGKTTLGDRLRDLYGFEHIDMETHPEEHISLVLYGEMFLNKIVNKQKNFVLTWGFYPPNDTQSILFLKKNGFKLIWLDGNRESALRVYTKRCKEKDLKNIEHHLENFHKQIKRIDACNVIKEINPIQINTFNKDGEFRNLDEVISEII